VLIGDMILPEQPVDGISAQGLVTIFPWPDGIVPYTFDVDVTSQNRDRTVQAMASWEALANVDFIPRTTESYYVRISNCNGNSSFVGRVGLSQQPQQLCMFNWSVQSIIIHELGHALGLYHEHQRPDRDDFIQVNNENIADGAESQFEIEEFFFVTVGAYDFDSIMHYGRLAFSDNGQPTIEPRPGFEQFANTIGTTSTPSLGDVQAVQSMYGGDSVTAPANDDPQQATIINENPFTATQLPNFASIDEPSTCAPTSDTVWYRFTAPGHGTLSVNTVGSNYDTVLTIYSGIPGNFTERACNDDIVFSVERQSSTSATILSGQTLYVQAATWSTTTTGELVFNASFELTGDLDDDGVITPSEAIYVINRLGTTDELADVDGSGTVTQNDATIVGNDVGATDQP
ncbi:MAG: M12 family metallopeptidase, partial [Chloroflexota bacterium]